MAFFFSYFKVSNYQRGRKRREEICPFFVLSEGGGVEGGGWGGGGGGIKSRVFGLCKILLLFWL